MNPTPTQHTTKFNATHVEGFRPRPRGHYPQFTVDEVVSMIKESGGFGKMVEAAEEMMRQNKCNECIEWKAKRIVQERNLVQNIYESQKLIHNNPASMFQSLHREISRQISRNAELGQFIDKSIDRILLTGSSHNPKNAGIKHIIHKYIHETINGKPTAADSDDDDDHSADATPSWEATEDNHSDDDHDFTGNYRHHAQSQLHSHSLLSKSSHDDVDDDQDVDVDTENPQLDAKPQQQIKRELRDPEDTQDYQRRKLFPFRNQLKVEEDSSLATPNRETVQQTSHMFSRTISPRTQILSNYFSKEKLSHLKSNLSTMETNPSTEKKPSYLENTLIPRQTKNLAAFKNDFHTNKPNNNDTNDPETDKYHDMDTNEHSDNTDDNHDNLRDITTTANMTSDDTDNKTNIDTNLDENKNINNNNDNDNDNDNDGVTKRLDENEKNENDDDSSGNIVGDLYDNLSDSDDDILFPVNKPNKNSNNNIITSPPRDSMPERMNTEQQSSQRKSPSLKTSSSSPNPGGDDNALDLLVNASSNRNYDEETDDSDSSSFSDSSDDELLMESESSKVELGTKRKSDKSFSSVPPKRRKFT